MAREEWIDRRLDNWARWLTEGNRHSLGYPRQQAFARQIRVSQSADTAHIPVDDVDARETHEAVENLRRVGQSHLWLVVHCRLVGDPRAPQHRRRPLGVKDTGQVMHLAEATVYAHMKRAKGMIKAHLDALHGGFTA